MSVSQRSDVRGAATTVCSAVPRGGEEKACWVNCSRMRRIFRITFGYLRVLDVIICLLLDSSRYTVSCNRSTGRAEAVVQRYPKRADFTFMNDSPFINNTADWLSGENLPARLNRRVRIRLSPTFFPVNVYSAHARTVCTRPSRKAWERG